MPSDNKQLLIFCRSCYGIDIPAYVFEDPGIQRIIDLQAELILLHVIPSFVSEKIANS